VSQLYTRTGDSGESSTQNGRFRKDALVFAALGDLDELTSWLGVVKEAEARDERAFLEEIQRALIALAADVAGYAAFHTDLIARLEAETDRLSSPGPFALVLPAGRLHVVRAVARRAERSLVAFRAHHPGLPFLNRLSDYLFALAESVGGL